MSSDAEFSHGPSILADVPEEGSSVASCKHASSNDAVASTIDTLNCPADKAQMEHNTASEVTGMEEIKGKSSGIDNSDDREGLSVEIAGAEKEDSSSEREPHLVTEMTRTEEMGCLSNVAPKSSEDKLPCDQSEKGELGSFDASCKDASSNEDVVSTIDTLNCPVDEVQMEHNTASEVTGIEDMGGISSGIEKSDDREGLNEESARSEKEEISCERAPHLVTEMTRIEEVGCLSYGAIKSREDKLPCDQSEKDEVGSVSVSCKDAPSSDAVVSNIETLDYPVEKVQMEQNTALGITSIEEIRGEACGPDKSDDEEGLSEEIAEAEKADSSCQRAPHLVTMMTRIEETGCLSYGAQESSEDKLTCNHSENVEHTGGSGQGEPNLVTKINAVSEIEGDSSGDINLVREGSADAGEVESDGQRTPSTVTKFAAIEEISDESNCSRKNDNNLVCEKSVDAEKEDSNDSMAPSIVTEITGIEAESNGAEKINIVTEITGIEDKSIGAEEISDDKLVSQESMNTGKADSSDERASNVVIEVNVIEEIEGEPDDTGKRTDGNSTCEERKDAEVANSGSPVHKGGLVCSTEVVAFGNENLNSSTDDIQSVPNSVETVCSVETGSESDGDKDIAGKVMQKIDVDSERLHTDGLGAEEMSCIADYSQGSSTLADIESSEVGNFCASSTKDVPSNFVVGSLNEALSSHADDCQLESNTSGVEKLEGESNGADNSINSEILCEEREHLEKLHKEGSDNVGVSSEAEVSNDQSVLADAKLSKVGNSSASSIKDVFHDDAIVSGNTLSDPIHDCKTVLNMAIDISGTKEVGGESSVANQTSDEKSTQEDRADAEQSPSVYPAKGMSSDSEICHDQSTLELPEAGNSSVSISSDVFSNDAVTSGNENLTYPIEIDQESANTSIEIADIEKVRGGSDMSNDDKLICEQSDDAENPKANEVLTTSSECSSVDAVVGQDVNVSAAKEFFFLVRMPRFDDEKLRDRIRVAESLVDEKTQLRDAFRQEIRNKRANCETHRAEFEAAKTHERDARRDVRAKRSDISTLQHVIDRAKNVVAVQEINTRIYNMEHMIGHETLHLKEEKLLIREIKQLKQLREQLSSSSSSQDEIQQAVDERGANEERLKTLKKELDNLKVKVSKAETIAIAASRKYENESQKLRELQAQFKAADDIRQVAYEELRNLKKELYEKNKHFRAYKDDANVAIGHAQKREKEALNLLCMNQVERSLELWNKDNEFRKEYVRCNTRSTVRRFGTFDGRTLGPDEEPIILPSYANERVNRLVSSVGRANVVSQSPVPQQEMQAVVLKDEIKDDKIKLQAAEGIKQMEKNKEAQKPMIKERSMIDEPKEQEPLQTAQELEAARKEEELRKQEEAARLKEQRRLEEIAKAKEALERKRRNAEKAQQRADLRAQKEEEQRLKEKEKRLRKKERRKAGAGETQAESYDAETAPVSITQAETAKEAEASENVATTTKKPQKPTQYTKLSKAKSSIPPPLRNRGRRNWQQWFWVFVSCIIIIALFFVGNIGFFSNLKQRQGQGPGF